MENQEILATLLHWFQPDNTSDLSLQCYEELFRISRKETHRKGTILLHLAEPFTQIGLVLRGAVRSYYLDTDGNAITKYLYEENHFIMDEGLLGYEKSLCTYETLEESEILFLPVRPFKEAVLASPELKDLYIMMLEKGLTYKISRENSFLTKTATQRYIDFCSEHPGLERRLPKSVIATYLGMTPESLSRIRHTLHNDRNT